MLDEANEKSKTRGEPKKKVRGTKMKQKYQNLKTMNQIIFREYSIRCDEATKKNFKNNITNKY
jgi:hypothetical protein